MLDAIAREAGASSCNVVISSEALADQSRIGDFARDLQSRLGSEFCVRFLFVAREHCARAASLYNQEVKDFLFHERRDPGAYLTDRATQFVYAPILRRLKSTGFAVDVLSFHPSEGFVVRFLTHVGFPADRLPQSDLRNISLSKKMLIAMLALNREIESAEAAGIYGDALRKMKGRFSAFPVIFEREAIAAVAHRFAADREYLSREFNIELPPAALAAEPHALRISEHEFADIAGALKGIGPKSKRILERIRPYVTPEAARRPARRHRAAR
jgi:hypothetical protein